ncbi:hypothetical protein [Halanaerobium sp. MA284_MarDTE_T2]|uniref:hypothetical protein n=1 Tax=Halanaerobium sp. MA284_MarDTE_T2 TaxID=2183913 RepID=UPI000DF2A8A0|nr:hypothetical protein [Halanaerobium sp. MA284_MarDTE_T2]RCW49744.1 hypothetical protein DFR78_10575 [Halanaerobium sp. MA284_MarDTE_T2]
MKEINNLSDYLETPKDTKELYKELQEQDIDWNIEQLELYLTLDSKVKKEADKWKMGEVSPKERVLDLLREELDSKPLVRIDKFVDNLPYGLVFGREDIISLVKASEDLKCPNSKVVTTKD